MAIDWLEIKSEYVNGNISLRKLAEKTDDISHSIKRGKLAKLDEGIKNAPITIVNPERNAVVYVTNINQGGLPIVAAFDLNAVFDGDEVHKATSIHLQTDTRSMLENLPESATVYVQKNEPDPVGATNNLRGLAAKIKFIDKSIAQESKNVNREESGETAKKGAVHFDGDRSGLTERQKVSLRALEHLAEMLGVQIHVYEEQDVEGTEHSGKNGWYDTQTGEMHINLRAGQNGEAVMLFTTAHELTHFIRQWSEAKFQTLADFLVAEYVKLGTDVDGLVMITGCRRGEIVGMKWGNVNWEDSSILINSALTYTPQRGVYESTTKTEDQRVIKLPKETMELLREYRHRQLEERLLLGEMWIPSDYILTGTFGGPMSPDSLSGFLKRFERRYGLPHIHAHKFRHSMASILYFSGADPVSISKRLGHAQVSTTQDMYAHLIRQADTQSAERIADAIFRSDATPSKKKSG